ncbi:F-box/LRR-repeat protein 4 [Glycine soja]|nr:F-box/LRR-repeat protein 4 [Glycine soja]
MRGHDWINTLIPDELLIEIFRRLDSKSSRLDSKSSLERFTRATIRIDASGSPNLFIHLLAARFSNVTTVHIDERLSVSIPAHLGRRRASGNSSVKLHYVNDKHGSASDQSDLDSLCISDSGLTALAEGFPKLEKLRLIFCSNVTSEGLSSLARKCTSLKSLDMQAFGCYVGDQGLAAVGQCCKQLEDLNLRFCEGLNDIGLVELALGVGNALKSLGVAACAKITDVSMEVVGSHCRSLETLSLDSEFIHNKGVLSVIKGCPHLKVLKLQCINLTDDVLKVVGARCLSLELLALYSFQRFTDKGLCAIGNGCKKLKNLTLSDCYFLLVEKWKVSQRTKRQAGTVISYLCVNL